MPKNDLVQSVARSLDLLERVARADEGLTLQELARALGVAPPTAHNLARTLVARGYLEKTSRPTRYRLGNAIDLLAREQQQRHFLQRAADAVQRLADEVAGATVTLVEARGGELQVRLRMSPELPGRLQRPDGMTMNAYITAHGLVYLACWTDAERADYRRRYPFEEFGAHAWQSLANLDAAIAEVSRRGYAQPPSATRELFRVAVPMFTASHVLAASLGLSLPLARLDGRTPEALVAAVQAAARRMHLPIPRAEE